MVKRGFRTLAVVAAMSMMLNPSMTVFAETNRVGTEGVWKVEGNKWIFTDGQAQKVKGWVVYKKNWYYLSPEDGSLKTGWLTLNGKSYFLSTESGQFTGRLLSGWQWIDGYCYYFIAEDNVRYGELFTGGKTPDGYTVDSAGRWTKDGTTVYENGKGLSSSENAQQVAGADRPIPSNGTGSSGGRSGSGSSLGGSSRGSGQSSGSGGTQQNASQGKQKEDSGNKGSATKEDDTKKEDPKKEEQEESKTASLVATAQTKLVHTELGNFLSFAFLDGTKEDYTVTVDGTDISAALTNVDDSGQIAKWRATVAHPKKLVISRKSDGKKQEIKLEEGKAQAEESTVEVVAGDPQDHPKYLLAQGTATVFDRLLPNNGKDGKERFTPKKSTFTLFEKKKEDPDAIQAEFYVKPVVIDAEGNGVGGKGIKAEFSLGTDKEKDWFNGIDQISLLRYEDNTVLNRNLSFKKTDPVSGKHGFVGTLQVPVGQDNMRSRGLYILAIHSKKTKEVIITLPIELQSNTRFQVDIAQETMAPKTGERVKFRINGENGESFGNEIKVDDMQVTLEKPSGKKEKLSYIDDYFNFGGNFILYGTSSNKEKTVNTDEAGMYTIKIKYSGYPTLSKQFIVYKGEGQSAEDKQEDAARSNARSAYSGKKADAVSAATSGKTSTHAGKKESGKKGKESVYDGVSSATATGTVKTPVKVVFDYDLLENALVLNEIKALNEDARNVLVWYYGMNFDRFGYLFDEGAKNYYSVEKYMNALKSDETKGGKIRSYSEYRKEAEEADFNGVSEVQFVLEDGTLGSLSDFKKYKGEDTPSFSGTTIKKGEDFTLITEDKEYIHDINGIYLDGESQNKLNEYYKTVLLDEKKGTIVIKRSAFNFNNTPEVGEHTLTIYAGEKYKQVDIILTITQEEINVEPKIVGEAVVGQDLTLSLAKAAVENFQSVSLQKKDGKVKSILNKSEGGDSGNDYYVLDEGNNQLIIKAGRFKEAGEYTVYVKIAGQNKTLNTTFQVKEKSAIAVPEGAEVKKGSFREVYYISFDNNQKSDEVTEYIAKVKSITVNGTVYNKINYAGNVYDTEDSFATLDIKGNNGKENAISISGSKMTGVKDKVIVQAEGYNDLVLSYPSTASRVRRSLLEDPFLEESSVSEEKSEESTEGTETTESAVTMESTETTENAENSAE